MCAENMNDDSVIIDERVINKIYLIRIEKVMLDSDLAELYGVETRRLNEQVKRNIDRFPKDFMFQLTPEEFKNLKSQIATSSWGGRRKPPFAFTEHGVLMLSSVLNSDLAIKVNIQIMRVYNKVRNMLGNHEAMLRKFEQLEITIADHDNKIIQMLEYLKQLEKSRNNEDDFNKRKRIGF
jgi:hypothetical protein